jgi:hypothetical protein
MQHLYEFDGYALDPPQRLVRSQARRPGTAPDRPGVRRIARTGGDGYWINLQAHFDLEMAKDGSASRPPGSVLIFWFGRFA